MPSRRRVPYKAPPVPDWLPEWAKGMFEPDPSDVMGIIGAPVKPAGPGVKFLRQWADKILRRALPDGTDEAANVTQEVLEAMRRRDVNLPHEFSEDVKLDLDLDPTDINGKKLGGTGGPTRKKVR